MEENGSGRFLYFTVLSVNLASFTMGTALAWSSPALPKLSGQVDPESNPLQQPITPSEESLIASLIAIGGLFGPFIAASIQDKLGRKRSTLIAVVPLYVSFIIIAVASEVWHFYMARFIAGVSISAIFVILPNYVAEISQNHNRGALSCMLVFKITLGMLVMYSKGPYISITSAALISLIAPTLFFIIVGIYIPDSPYHLIKKDRQAAASALAKLRGKKPSQIKPELAEIKKSVEESFAGDVGMVDVFRNKILLKGLVITCGLVFFQQCSGVNAILFYMQSLFVAAGSDLSPAISTIIIAITQNVFALIAPLLVDRLGRRFLLFVSCFGCSVALAAIGIFFYIKENGNAEAISWLPIASLIVFIATYSVGYGPMPFTILGEIFPPNFKAVASMLTITVCFLFTFVTTMIFPYLLVAIGTASSFCLFLISCVFSSIFIYFLLPETKGKSFIEIQNIMNNS